MSSSYGERIRLSLFGQSHGEAVGMILDGLPAGESIDLEHLQNFLDRRAPGRSRLTTSRKEADRPRFLSGLWEGKTCGAPLCAIIENTDARSADYEQLADIPRPGHADWPAWVKHHGCNDYRGGGHFSARLTAPFCVAGGILLQLLEQRGIQISARLFSVGEIKDESWDAKQSFWPSPQENEWGLPVFDAKAAAAMAGCIQEAAQAGDSLGGQVECCVQGLPVGMGEPFFDSLESCISHVVFSIPGIKGLEFGSGFACAGAKGSENNDPYQIQEDRICTASNHHGGILGGLSSGMPLIFRAAFKPTSSIAQKQRSVSMRLLEERELQLSGRHDPCIAIRAVPCVEAAAAIALSQFVF
ncbi:MAG: chorismate synthase [Firmicutes bacterium]|nr:chorismate synthase [Bacillota bacterium]